MNRASCQSRIEHSTCFQCDIQIITYLKFHTYNFVDKNTIVLLMHPCNSGFHFCVVKSACLYQVTAWSKMSRHMWINWQQLEVLPMFSLNLISKQYVQVIVRQLTPEQCWPASYLKHEFVLPLIKHSVDHISIEVQLKDPSIIQPYINQFCIIQTSFMFPKNFFWKNM